MTRKSRSKELNARFIVPALGNELILVEKKIDEAANHDNDLLSKMIFSTIEDKGKMIRPTLALLGGKTGNYNIEALVPLAGSVELLHTATLVHDDVVDSSNTRRGKPSAQINFNNKNSILLGDYLFASAASFIAETNNNRVISLFSKTLRSIVSGELVQNTTEFEYDLNMDIYFDKIIGKTASLFATAVEGGGIVSGCSDAENLCLRRYGLNLGIAFQIIDDILDFTGDNDLGKPTGQDLLSGKLTLPSLLFLKDNPKSNLIKQAFKGTRVDSNLKKAITAIQESTALRESQKIAKKFADAAVNNIEPMRTGLNPRTRHAFEVIANEVISRNK
jgi:heptaprenyl diphosphate synthase